ncbi:MAG: hypothetical protein RBU21_15010 [FCB group bacterium]|nr:hypothetical protein [FCB group bacterium]
MSEASRRAEGGCAGIARQLSHGTELPLLSRVSQAGRLRLRRYLALRRWASGLHAEMAVGIGPLGRDAARLLGALSGAEVALLPDDAGIHAVRGVLQGGVSRTVLVAVDPALAGAASLAGIQFECHEMRGVSVGFIVAHTLESTAMQVLKSLTLPSETQRGVALISTSTDIPLRYESDEGSFLCGTDISREDVDKVLSKPSRLLLIEAHGNGFCLNLGRYALCSRSDGRKVRSGYLPACFHTGDCPRQNHVCLDFGALSSELLVLATCWGAFEVLPDFPHSATGSFQLACSPTVGAFVTSLGVMRTGPEDLLRYLALVWEGLSAGECVRRFNLERKGKLDPFVLFGNPRKTLELGAPRIHDLPHDPDGRQASGALAPGLTVVRSRNGSRSQSRLGSSGRQPAPPLLRLKPLAAAIATRLERPARARQFEWLIASGVPVEAKVARHEPFLTALPGKLNQLTSYSALGEAFLPALSNTFPARKESLSELAAQLVALRLSAHSLAGAVLEALERGVCHVSYETQYCVFLSQWKKIHAGMARELLLWAETVPSNERFLDHLYEPLFERREGPESVCPGCGNTGRIVLLSQRLRGGMTRAIRICPFCGIQSDMPGNQWIDVHLELPARRSGTCAVRVRAKNSRVLPSVVSVCPVLVGTKWSGGVDAPDCQTAVSPTGQEFTLQVPHIGLATANRGPERIEVLGIADGAPFLARFPIEVQVQGNRRRLARRHVFTGGGIGA